MEHFKTSREILDMVPEKRLDVNMRNHYGYLLLYEAITRRRGSSVVRRLLERGMDPILLGQERKGEKTNALDWVETRSKGKSYADIKDMLERAGLKPIRRKGGPQSEASSAVQASGQRLFGRA